jgi:glycosyltransferase involved in cell wall biosynthesis
MKICLLIEGYPPNTTGGVSVYGQRLAQGLVKAGHDVFVIATCPIKGFSFLKPLIRMDGAVKVLEISPINIYDAYSRKKIPMALKALYHIINLWNPFQYKILKGILKNERPDVVHIHDIYGISLCLLDAAKSLGIPLILTLHSYGLICRKVTLLKANGKICEKLNNFCSIYCQAIKEIIDSKPDLVTSPSQFVLDYHTRMGFFSHSKKTKLSNGIEVNNSMSPKKIHGNCFNILFVGRLGRHKGVHILIEAVKKMTSNQVHLHIIGNGDYRADLERIASNDKRITFHGIVPDSELPTFYGMADVTVVPSIWLEVAPVVIQESFNAGTPVIGSRIGGIPEMIIPGYNGLLFNPGNVDELMLILQRLMSDRHELETMGKNAYQSLRAYSMSSHVEHMLRLYSLAEAHK